MLEEAQIAVPGSADLEISHHYGIDEFERTGLVLITVVNRGYCKKLLVSLPGPGTSGAVAQREGRDLPHPARRGASVARRRNARSAARATSSRSNPACATPSSRPTGAIIEEISTTHNRSDSFYTDDSDQSEQGPQNLAHLLDGMMVGLRVADWIMSRLADLGVREVFLLPGGGAMHLNDGLACEKRLVPIPCHHEQACGIAAEAWGRSRDSFGVCLVTTGPGATNAITPVAGAWIDSVPMLVISGQVKRADRIAGRPLRQGGVQEVDIVPMVKSITKYAVTVTEPEQIRYHLERALYEMRHGRPGPVWLDIPLDVQAAPVDPAS